MTDDQVIEAMLTMGGNFMQRLALAYRAADLENRLRIRTAFADKWAEYAELARLRQVNP